MDCKNILASFKHLKWKKDNYGDILVRKHLKIIDETNKIFKLSLPERP